MPSPTFSRRYCRCFCGCLYQTLKRKEEIKEEITKHVEKEYSEEERGSPYPYKSEYKASGPALLLVSSHLSPGTFRRLFFLISYVLVPNFDTASCNSLDSWHPVCMVTLVLKVSRKASKYANVYSPRWPLTTDSTEISNGCSSR